MSLYLLQKAEATSLLGTLQLGKAAEKLFCSPRVAALSAEQGVLLWGCLTW